jgi:transposase
MRSGCVQVLTDAQWAVLEPLVLAVRPRGKTPHADLRRTMAAILWRHQNGAKWRAIPAELGPWWGAAQTFIRWAKQGVWERLLALAQARAGGVELCMAFLDGTSLRAHAKAAGAPEKIPWGRRVCGPGRVRVPALTPPEAVAWRSRPRPQHLPTT